MKHLSKSAFCILILSTQALAWGDRMAASHNQTATIPGSRMPPTSTTKTTTVQSPLFTRLTKAAVPEVTNTRPVTFVMQGGKGAFLPGDHKQLVQLSLELLMAIGEIKKAYNGGPGKSATVSDSWKAILAGEDLARAYLQRGDVNDTSVSTGDSVSLAERAAKFVSLVATVTAKLPSKVRGDVFVGNVGKGAFLRFASSYAFTVADGLPLTWRLELGNMQPVVLTDRN